MVSGTVCGSFLDTSTFRGQFRNICARLDLPAIVEAKESTADELYAFNTIPQIRSNDAVQEA